MLHFSHLLSLAATEKRGLTRTFTLVRDLNLEDAVEDFQAIGPENGYLRSFRGFRHLTNLRSLQAIRPHATCILDTLYAFGINRNVVSISNAALSFAEYPAVICLTSRNWSPWKWYMTGI
jgi:hypothetical protein